MNAALSIVTASTGEPLTTTEVRDHVRGSTADNTLIANQAKAARLYCENFTHREFMLKTLRYSLDEWPRSFIELPRPVNGSTAITAPVVSYRQQGNSTFTTFGSTNYLVDSESEPGRIVLKFGATWPTDTLEAGQSVRVDFPSGAAVVADVQQSLKQGILLLSAHWYENRESVAVGTISTTVQQSLHALLFAHKIPSVP